MRGCVQGAPVCACVCIIIFLTSPSSPNGKCSALRKKGFAAMSTLVVVKMKAIVEAAELKAAMETFGRVAKCEKHHTCPNMAFVTYEDAASAERAVAGGSSIMLGGMSIKVQADKRGGDGTPAAKPAAGVELPVVVVKDLRGDEAALRELMARFGKVEACVVHPSNPMLAFVTFDDLASARRALAGGTGLQLGDGGAAIRVERYRTNTGAAKGSFEAEKLMQELARAKAKAAAAEEALAASKLEAAAEIAELGKAVVAEAAEKEAARRARASSAASRTCSCPTAAAPCSRPWRRATPPARPRPRTRGRWRNSSIPFGHWFRDICG